MTFSMMMPLLLVPFYSAPVVSFYSALDTRGSAGKMSDETVLCPCCGSSKEQ